MKYDTLVLIGRFQPVHSAHVELIHRAMSLSKQLIIIVGSTDLPCTFKNPWNYMERRFMLAQAIASGSALYNCNVFIESNTDSVYNDAAWATRVQYIASKYHTTGNIAIIGHKKDASSFYLDMFPQWGFEEVELLQPLNATKVRDYYFSKDANMNFLSGVVPEHTLDFLSRWKKTNLYKEVIAEREFVDKYKKQYASLPYAPVFVTVDTIVTCANHVLMVKRKAFPGKGLWALPGGFLDANKDTSIVSAAIRELKEETSIKVPIPVLTGSITKSKVFDAIDRSTRGRTITHAFLIELNYTTLPKVRGEDDAEVAKFIPYAEIFRDRCYEDHFDMCQSMVGF